MGAGGGDLLGDLEAVSLSQCFENFVDYDSQSDRFYITSQYRLTHMDVLLYNTYCHYLSAFLSIFVQVCQIGSFKRCCLHPLADLTTHQ